LAENGNDLFEIGLPEIPYFLIFAAKIFL